MRPSQIQAVEHVVIEAHPSAREALIWFYGELAELPQIPLEKSETAQVDEPYGSQGADALESTGLCFRSARIELRILFKENPRVERNKRRAVVSVRDLESTIVILQEREIEYQRLSGLGWTDRRVSLLDPGGNRVELKHEWRRGVIGPPKREQLPDVAHADDQRASGNPAVRRDEQTDVP